MTAVDDWDDLDWDGGEDAASWRPEPIPRPYRPQWNVSIRWTYPPGTPQEEVDRLGREAWNLHVTAALLEERCPKCLGPLLEVPPEFDDRPGWRRCRFRSYPDGWWKRTPDGCHSWQLGMNPHTGEYDWRP